MVNQLIVVLLSYMRIDILHLHEYTLHDTYFCFYLSISGIDADLSSSPLPIDNFYTNIYIPISELFKSTL